MGTMNLLQASVQGKLGSLYGARDKKAKVIKAIPFSHTPHNATQTRCVRAFEVLCRFSAGVSAAFFPFMGLSDRKMLRHNAVAQFFKPMVLEKAFNLSAGQKVIPDDGSCSIVSLDVDKVLRTLSVTAETTGIVDKKNGKAWFVGVFASNGRCLFSTSPDTQSYFNKVTGLFDDAGYYFAVAFRSDVESGKVRLHGWASTDLPLVINQYVQIDRFPTVSNYSVANGRLVINDPSVSVRNGRVVVNV